LAAALAVPELAAVQPLQRLLNLTQLVLADGLRAQDRENLLSLLDQRHAEELPILPLLVLDSLMHRHLILPDFNGTIAYQYGCTRSRKQD
jgi:hypothetical protein